VAAITRASPLIGATAIRTHRQPPRQLHPRPGPRRRPNGRKRAPRPQLGRQPGAKAPLGQGVQGLVSQGLDVDVGEDLGVIWSAMACWMAGSAASGATVRTDRSVLVTWLRAHTATPPSGASTQPSTISTTATIVRQRCRDPGPGPAGPRSTARPAAAPGRAGPRSRRGAAPAPPARHRSDRVARPWCQPLPIRRRTIIIPIA
jgi:hypothetical protein